MKVIFDVKGLVHPPRKVIAFPRYIPSAEGTRERGGNLYGKVYNLAERFQYLQRSAPELIVFDPVFGETLCEVPTAEVTQHYKPVEKLAYLRNAKNPSSLERKAVLLAETLKEQAGIPWSSIGISGSIMAGLSTLKSDIDPLVYGVENCRKAYAALRISCEERSVLFQAIYSTGIADVVRVPFERHYHELRRLRAGRRQKSVPGLVHGSGLFRAVCEGLE